ncbi:hypothetical protein [Fodinibius saliphilus]|uniref:hypothetical protein n=1 Tax=Fodinibius saliphilus TaxID=1920650 RepID=UPI001109526E|nr:hypothetical protein [Fodinibius saliphilus]
MRQLIVSSVFICFFMMSISTANAQEMPKAKKMEGHTWHQVVLVKYKPGTINKAKNIIKNHFEKAGMESDVPGPQVMEMKTGEWDMMFIWTMKDISEMEWEVHPNDEKWWAAMAKQEGGMEKAMKVMTDYMDLINQSTSYLATTQEEMTSKTMGSNN